MSTSPLLLLHVSAGSTGLLSGAFALSFRKGAPAHRVAGNVFFLSMLLTSAAGAYLASRKSEMDNVFGGVLTFYLVVTSWLTVRRENRQTGILDWIGLLAASAIAVSAVIYGIKAAYAQTDANKGTSAGDYVLPAVVAIISATGDARMIVRGGLCGTQRIARHLWRMCFALFAASASIFLARPQLFPALLTRTHVLFVLGILPLAMMVFWLARIFFTNAFQRGVPVSKA